ncbi:hypothetical protein [uncultured Paraglaciecola sp.]|nr:hypothetical protein [uncultured Paraglaciecola sp.]
MSLTDFDRKTAFLEANKEILSPNQLTWMLSPYLTPFPYFLPNKIISN